MTSLLDSVRAGVREAELQWATEEERAVELTDAEKWARDPIGWLEAYAWIWSDAHGRAIRLELLPNQQESIEAWIDLGHLAKTGRVAFRNVVIEKSRQIGETWGFAAAICWLLHYHDVAGLVKHRDLAEVDDGGERSTRKSIFGKIRFVDKQLDRTKLRGLPRLAFRWKPSQVTNPSRGSTIYGEGEKDDPGRGGRFDFALLDEAAFMRHGEQVFAALGDACPDGKVLLSTVNGDGNVHARIADTKPAGWRYLRLHWSQHPTYGKGGHIAGEDDGCRLCEGNRAGAVWSPDKPVAHRYPGRLTSPWYDRAVADKTDAQVANELDIDRERALAGRVYPEFQTDVHVVSTGVPLFDRDLLWKTELAWDYGTDVTSIVVCQDAPEEYRVVGLFEAGTLINGQTAIPDTVAPGLNDYLAALGVPAEYLVEKWTRRFHCVGDPFTGSSLDTGRTMAEAYRRRGWEIQTPPRRYVERAELTVVGVARLLIGRPKPLRVCGVNAADFALHARNNTWPTDATGRRRIGSTRPYDDVHNHSMRAFAYLVCSKWPPPMTDEPRATAARTPSRHRDGVISPDVRYGMRL